MPRIKSKSILLAINTGAILGWFALWGGLIEVLNYLDQTIFKIRYFSIYNNLGICYFFIIFPIALTTYEIWFANKENQKRNENR